MTKNRDSREEQPTTRLDQSAFASKPLNRERHDSEPLRVGSWVGPYELVEFLGAGGMGTVFLAQQTEPVTRTVALKVVQPRLSDGAESWEYDQRFAAERQALAKLSHPNVAQLYDSGETAGGQPFFAMEFVKGKSITQYCDENCLDVHQRLQLFLAVCRGVEHAHQNGVLHRDLKPDNVLVGMGDLQPLPKIIDFGIAKGIDEPLAAVTQLTHGGVVGTLAYLSPEAIRAAQGRATLDTRADVFSLGILLHELLVGARPQNFTSHNTAEVLERILAADLPSPSVHWNSLTQEQRARASGDRESTPEGILAALIGDLDWIVLRATAQNREDRYPSAGALAADLDRHLDDLPVEARPPSRIYSLRKFVRRNRVGVAAAVAFVLALILGMIGTFAGFLQARAEQEHSDRQAQAALQAQQESDSVVRFMVGLFKASSPGADRRDLEAVGEVLKRGADQLRSSLEDQPAVRARLLLAVGEILKELGDYPSSTQLLEEAVRIRRGQTGEGASARLRTALNELGMGLVQAGDYSAAAPVLREAVDLQMQLADGNGVVISSLGNLANALRSVGRKEEALEIRRQLVEMLEAESPEGRESLARALAGLAKDLQALDERNEAKAAYDRSISMIRQHVADQPMLLGIVLINAASAYENPNDVATGMLRESRDLLENSVGPDHPATLASIQTLANRLRETDVVEAQRLLLDVTPRIEHAFGLAHPNSVTAAFSLSLTYLQQGQLETAVDQLEAVLERRRSSSSKNLDQRSHIEASLAAARCAQDRAEETQTAVAAMLGSLAKNDKEASSFGHSLVACSLLLAGSSRESEARYRVAHQAFKDEANTDSVLEGQILLGLGKSLALRGQDSQAGAQFEAAEQAFRTELSEDHFWLAKLAAAREDIRG